MIKRRLSGGVIAGALGLIEQHCEKGVLGLGAALALWLAWAFLLQTPNRVVLDGRSVTPRELHRVILREAEALERGMDDVEMPLVQVPSYGRRLKMLHEGGIFGGEDKAGALLGSPKLRLAAAFGSQVDFAAVRERAVRVVTPTAPERPRVITGRCLRVGERGDGSFDAAEAAAREVGWVRIVSRFDRERRRAALLAANYPEYAATVYLVGVDAQRQELLANGGYGEWAAVKPAGVSPLGAIPRAAFDDRTGRLLNRDALNAALAEVKAGRATVGRPAFGEVLAGDRPAVRLDADVAGGGAELNADSELTWVDDAEIEAGRIYRYRVRVRLWNRFVGRTQAVVEAADAERAVIEGEWSDASDPIRAAPRTHFFVTGRSVTRSAANIEVWKWHRGRWLRASFAVGVGEAIGGERTTRCGARDETGRAVRGKVDFNTGATLLDVRQGLERVRTTDAATGRFGWTERSGLVVVCMDRASGYVLERSQAADRRDPVRERLRRP